MTRQASTTRRFGAGSAKGRTDISRSSTCQLSTADAGTTETPAPEATMCLTVSSELPSSAPPVRPAPERFGQAWTTWSRKQLPLTEEQKMLGSQPFRLDASLAL